MPHAPLGVINVPLVAGNNVYMHMVDALPGRRPHIDADVVAIRTELLGDESFFLLNEAHAGSDLFRCQLEKTGDMPARDDQRVSRTRRVGVARTECQFMLYRYPARICAKQAWVIGVSFLCCFRRRLHTCYTRAKEIIDEGNIVASNNGRAYFALLGYHFNPDDITRLLGIEPTSVNAAGTYSGLDKPVISSWELSTENTAGVVDVFALTDSLVRQLEPLKEKIVEVCKSHNLSPRLGVALTFSIDKGESSPEVGFGARTIRFLADTGSFIEVENKLSGRV